jgi:hypothetical protein
MHAISFARPGRIAGVCRLTLAVISIMTGLVATGQEPAGPSFPMVTNIAQLRRLSSQGTKARYSIRLEGNVWWANPTQRKLVHGLAHTTVWLKGIISAARYNLGVIYDFWGTCVLRNGRSIDPHRLDDLRHNLSPQMDCI